MKNYSIYICLTAALISLSCNESFNPEAPFKEQYVLNCIIRGDSLMQMAVLGETYDANGTDPSLNTVDPSIAGAPVYIKWKKQIFQMRDSSIARTDTSRYKDPLKFYYTKAFKPSFHDSLEITAYPAAGVVLSSKIRVPNGVVINFFPTWIADTTRTIQFSWIQSDGNCFFLPRLKILYKKRNEIPAILHTMEVPVSYNTTGGVTTPVYPGISEATGVEYQINMVNDYILKVSQGDDKDNYQFYSLQLELLIFDQYLAAYISTTNGFPDNLSIRLDEPNYTNIKGGLGIFGSYLFNNNITISFSAEYLMSLGYTQ